MTNYLLNISEFVYFVCGLSPPKRSVVVRWRNFARRRVPTIFRTCAAFYVYRARRYENDDIFPKLRADRPTLLLRWVNSGNGSVVRGRPIPAGWLAGRSSAMDWYSDVAGVSQCDWPCVFNNVGRWPKRAGCMQLPRANQATKSSCSGPTGRNILFSIFARR